MSVTVYGAPSETDIEQQVSILENAVARHPDDILIAPSSSDASADAIAQAMKEGIPVATADNRVRGVTATAHLATDNLKARGLAADKLVELLKASGQPLKGKIGMLSAEAGVEVLTQRDKGFKDRLAVVAPDLKVLPVRYIDNDIQKAMSSATDVISANPDIVGFFADNNHSADGTSLAVRSSGKEGKLVVIGFDSDPQEVDAPGAGTLSALVVQDPYSEGYMGVDYVMQAIAGKKLPAYTDTGVALITKANMDDPKMKGLLNSSVAEGVAQVMAAVAAAPHSDLGDPPVAPGGDFQVLSGREGAVGRDARCHARRSPCPAGGKWRWKIQRSSRF